jgi:hypothetical protein
MAEAKKRHAWRRFRKIFRWCRIAVLLVIAFFCFGLLWLNYVGLPGFARDQIVAELRRNNFDLDFERLRLRGFFHIVADKVRLKTIRDPLSPRFSADRAEFHLNGHELVRLNYELQEILFTKGSLSLPLATNSNETLTIQNVEAAVSFPVANHIWINELHGESMGIHFSIGGYIFNADEWARPRPGQKRQVPFDWRPRLAKGITELLKIDFPQPPDLQLQFRIDGKAEHPTLVTGDLKINAASTEQFRFQNSTIHMELNPSELTNTLSLKARAELFNIRSKFGGADRALFLAGMELPTETNGTFGGKASLEAEGLVLYEIGTPHARVDLTLGYSGTNLISEVQAETSRATNAFGSFANSKLKLSWTNGPIVQLLANATTGTTNALEASAGGWILSLDHPSAGDTKSEGMQISGTLNFDPARAEGPISPGNVFRTFASTWKAEATNLFIKEVQSGRLEAEGSWSFPQLLIDSLKTDLYQGHAQSSVSLNTQTMVLTLGANGDFDYQKISPLLDPTVAVWLAQFSWEEPPKVQATMSLTLPKGAKTWPDWEQAARKTLHIAGEFAGRASLEGIPFDWVSSHFEFRNDVWTLPDLQLRRPEGEAAVEYEGNIRTLDYRFYINSHLHPGPIKALLGDEQRRVLDMLEFDEAPEIEGQLWGNWEHDERAGFSGKIRAQNFWVQDERFSDIEARVQYTNFVITCEQVVGHRGKEEVQAERLQIFPLAGVMWVTNAVSTINPYVAMKLVGPDILRVIQPYQFPEPPLIYINGAVPLGDLRKANLHFKLTGENFSYWRFHMPRVSGDIYWKGLDLDITNVQASFYSGQAGWAGHFYFPLEKDSADFSFHAAVTNADLKLLMQDLQDPHTPLEGVLNGTLTITSANSDDWKSWNGHGHAELKDGFLWDVPIFGTFTKALTAINPSLALSRITSGTADYKIKNSVISSKNLELRAPVFRLKYQGDVDFEGKVDAKVEALLLRDTWMMGRVFSTVLWPVSKVFEAKVTGTLNDPKRELKHFPKVMSAPFRAAGALREILVQKGEQEANKPATPKSSD